MNKPRLHRSCIFGRMTFAALALIVLSDLLLCAARPAHAQTETVLYNFTGGNDGGLPNNRLTSDGAGNYYGLTNRGGTSGAGTVFELSPNGDGWNETVLYSFCPSGLPSCTGGGFPDSYALFDASGNLYGTAYNGGAYFDGAVFELSPGAGGWTETVLYNFTGGSDAGPFNGLIMDSEGNLYGITNPFGYSGGPGNVYELSPSGGSWTEHVIYTADNLYAGLVMDSSGNIFGATLTTVFELSPNGNGGWNSSVLHTFVGGPKDGTNVWGALVLDKAGNIYGATGLGGPSDVGGVFELSLVTKGKKKGTWKEKILYFFKNNGKDAEGPSAGIVFDEAGNIYGTTNGGGKFNDGAVYELVAPEGKGGYKEKVLWSFNGTDGSQPLDSLILDSAGNLYGTTLTGGSAGQGVVFEVTP